MNQAPNAGARRARFAWVLNLDAELELERSNHQTPERLRRQLAEHGSGARALLGPGDVLLTAGETADPVLRATPEPSTFVGRAWCPTPRALAVLRAAGVEPEPYPSLEVLRRVNHRRFACELGGGLPGQRYCAERAELDAVLAHGGWPHLLKRPLEFAGRGQLRLFAAPRGAEAAWIEASFARGGLILEPLVTPVLELSLHGFVWQRGQCEIGNACIQEVSERGVFKSARRARPGELARAEAQMLSATAERVAAALHGSGYFGPFGIDAFRYRGERESGFCALSEINARYTLGFVTGFPRPASELDLASPAGLALR